MEAGLIEQAKTELLMPQTFPESISIWQAAGSYGSYGGTYVYNGKHKMWYGERDFLVRQRLKFICSLVDLCAKQEG